MLLFIGATEVIFIVFAVLLLFGSKKIPEVARALGKGYREFQKATEEIKREISDVEKDDQSRTDTIPPPPNSKSSNTAENQ